MKNTELENIHKTIKTDKKKFVSALDDLISLAEKIKLKSKELEEISPKLMARSSMRYNFHTYNHNDTLIDIFSKIKDCSVFKDKDIEMLELVSPYYAPFVGSDKETRTKFLEYLQLEGKFPEYFFSNIPKLKRIIKALDPNHKITGTRSSGYEIRDSDISIVHLKEAYSNVFSGHEKKGGISVNMDISYSFASVGSNWTLSKTVIKHNSFKDITEKEMMFILKDSSAMFTIKNHHKTLKNFPDYIKDHLILQ